MISNKLLPVVAILMLCGAGCFSKVPDDTANPIEAGKSHVTAASTSNIGGTEAVQTGDTSSTPVTIDATWKTYHSASSGFSFRYPTKGIYVPHWEVKYYDENYIEPGYVEHLIKDGCVVDGSFNSKSTFKDFCHSRSSLEMPEQWLLDYYALKKGNRYIVIAFSKQVYGFEGYATYSLNTKFYVPFNDEKIFGGPEREHVVFQVR